jgi:hypothetical protein
MATEIVARVNKEARALLDHLKGSRENPHLISLTTSFVRLTNTPAQNDEMDRAEPPKPACPHDTVNRKTGKCTACGEVPED